jgi:cytochrome c553
MSNVVQELEQTRANVTKADALQEALEFAQMELARTNDELSAALMVCGRCH